MTTRARESSPQTYAGIGGAIYVAIIMPALFGLYSCEGLIVPDDAAADAHMSRHPDSVTQQVPIDGRDDAIGARIRVRRTGDVDLALPEPVDAERLLVCVGGQPVEEDAAAGSQRRPAAFEW